MTKILMGNSLSPELAKYLKSKIAGDHSVEFLPASLWKFSATQSFSEFFSEKSMNDNNVIVVQSLGGIDFGQNAQHSSADFAMQLVSTNKSLKRAGANKIWNVVPYTGFARQDRHVDGRNVSIAIDDLAEMLKTSGAEGVSVMDMHSDAGVDKLVNHFGAANVYHLNANELFAAYINENIGSQNIAVGGPDAGAHERAADLAQKLGAGEFAFTKRHTGVNDTEVTGFDGDVKDKTTITLDDEIDTGGTITNAQKELKDRGASRRIILGAHGVFSKGGLEKVFTAGARGNRLIDQIVVTDSIRQDFNLLRLEAQYGNVDDIERVVVLPTGDLWWHHIQDDILKHSIMKPGV